MASQGVVADGGAGAAAVKGGAAAVIHEPPVEAAGLIAAQVNGPETAFLEGAFGQDLEVREDGGSGRRGVFVFHTPILVWLQTIKKWIVI